jgi:hypothetical protein
MFCSLRALFIRKTHSMMRFPLACLIALFVGICSSRAEERLLKPDDVIAFVGGENMVAVSDNGFLELSLTRSFPDLRLRFRNLAWEGDTVFEQNRDLNFPTWEEQMDKIGVTVVVAQFGQMESLAGRDKLPGFVAAYEKLIERWSAGGKRRIVLLAPVLFSQSASPVGKDAELYRQEEKLKSDNDVLDDYIDAIREIAEKYHALFVNDSDLGVADVLVQRDGIHLTNTGQMVMAGSIAKALGGRAEMRPSRIQGDASLLLQLVNAKNRLWFNYWRVQNWAFLAGDRTSQPSSRDWRDPSIRWFPPEREKFLPLIAEKENEIWEFAGRLP